VRETLERLAAGERMLDMLIGIEDNVTGPWQISKATAKLWEAKYHMWKAMTLVRGALTPFSQEKKE